MKPAWVRPWRAAVALALVPVLLMGSILVGLRVPGMTYPRSAAPSALDYSRHPVSGVTGLRTPFIEDVLGSAVGFGSAPVAGFFSGSETPPEILDRLDTAPRIVTHPLVNDDFVDAYRVNRLPFSANTNTIEATAESGEPSNCTRVGDKTVWYRLDLPVDAGLIADTFGTDHAVDLRVFSGRGLRDLTAVGCSTSARGDAHVPFSGKGGTRYYFQVSAISGGSLWFNVRLQGATKPLPGATAYNAIYAGGSTDGRYWAFSGTGRGGSGPTTTCGVASNVPLLQEGCPIQAYVVDTHTKEVSLVSQNLDGREADGGSLGVSVSAGGRFVAYWSTASDLVEGDTNTCHVYQFPGSCFDVFVRDRDTDRDGKFDEDGAVRNVRVSVSSSGAQGNGWSGLGLISADGRFVAFQSEATNLVPGDTNGVGDGFVHDRDADRDGIFDETHAGARRTIRVTVSTTGAEARSATDVNGLTERRDYLPFEQGNHMLGISANGRYAVFRSAAGNLVPGDRNGAYDVFLRDIVAGTTTRVNVSSSGREADKGTRLHNGFARPVSDDGRYVLFNSDATNLVERDTNQSEDLFMRDLLRGTTKRITVDRGGKQVTEPPAPGRDIVGGGLPLLTAPVFLGTIFTTSEMNHAMSADGRYVFFSSAAQLVPEDDDEHRDLYVRDVHRGILSLASVSSSGEKGNASSNYPWPSRDGRVLGFGSTATNLDDSGDDDRFTTGFGGAPYLRFLPPDP